MQNELAERPQYIARKKPGSTLQLDLHPNDAATKLMTDYRKMEVAYERMIATFAGAKIASIFAECPGLAEFTFELEATSEYDDSGGTYRTVHATVSKAKLNPETSAGEETGDDYSHADDVAYSLNEALDDDVDVLYSAFADDRSYGSVRLTVSRVVIQDLLVEDVMEGFEAFIRLFPEYKASVMDPSSKEQGQQHTE